MQQQDVSKRRKARQRKARRRRMKIFLILFLVIALLVLAIMCFTVFFPIKRISVSGSNIYSKAEIIKASGITTDDNLFIVSEETIENKIRKELPYIDSVELKRHLPDAVVLTVCDAEEYSCFEIDSQYFVVSKNGYVLKTETERPQNVFEIKTSGVKCEIGKQVEYDNSAEKDMILNIISLLENQKINIDKIDVSNILNLTVSVENKFVVNLGTDEYIEQKIAHLSGMIKSIGERKGDINLSMWSPKNTQGSFVEKVE